MARRLIDLRDAKPLLDVASYARRGPGRRDHLSQAEIELIDRTVRRAPEVMVKVLARGGQDLKGVARHVAYLNRGGDVEIDTDDGQQLSGKGVEKELLEDWDLDLEEHRRTNDLESRSRRTPPKLVHKLMFSMPPGTPPGKVLAAVKNFAREEFALKHRYAMVLHVDEPHPHVHMVVKAVSEEGDRLNIRRATLREWRREFARQLRAQGISANATDKATRGATRPQLSDGMYRAMQRGASHRILGQGGGGGLERTGPSETPSRESLQQTRGRVERGWMAAAEMLDRQGQEDMARYVRRFIKALPAVRTDRELLRQAARRAEQLTR